MKKIIFLSIIMFGFLVVLVVVGGGNDFDTKAPVSNQNINTTDDLIIGDPSAKVTIVEYADYKCPECGKHHADAGKKIIQDYVSKGLVKINFRPYPVYEDGADALYASYCVNEQGKLQQYHDYLFDFMWKNHYQKGDYQKSIDSVFTTLFIDTTYRSVSIDKTKVEECIASKKYDRVYQDNLLRAAEDEVQGTPTFYIGGQKIVGPQPYQIFKTLIDLELAKN